VRRKRKWRLRIGLAAVLASLVGSASYAYTASDTVPATYAGDGSTAISGYTVGSLAYTLDGSNPSNVDAVTFTLTPSAPLASHVSAQLAAGGAWYSCTVAAGNSITCATTSPQATAVGATQLTVVAVQ